LKKNLKKKKKKNYKYRYNEGALSQYETKEELFKAVREAAAKNELVGSTANMFSRKAGFAIYKAAEIHLFGEDLTDEEIKELMEEVDDIVREEKNKICCQKEQAKKE